MLCVSIKYLIRYTRIYYEYLYTHLYTIYFMVGSILRFLLFTRCEGSLNSLVCCAHSFVYTHSCTMQPGPSRGGGGTRGYYPGARAKKGPGHKLLQIYKYCKIWSKTNRRLTEKPLRAYGFLQPAFINVKILGPTTDLNGFSLMKRKISYNRDYVGLTLPI